MNSSFLKDPSHENRCLAQDLASHEKKLSIEADAVVLRSSHGVLRLPYTNLYFQQNVMSFMEANASSWPN